MDSPLKQVEERERNQSFTGIVLGIFFLVIAVIIIWFSVLRSKPAQPEAQPKNADQQNAPAASQKY